MSELIKAAEKWAKTDYVLCVNALEEAEDLIPALIEQIQQANKDKAELVEALLEAADVCETWIASDYSPHKKYRAIAAKHKEDV